MCTNCARRHVYQPPGRPKLNHFCVILHLRTTYNAEDAKTEKTTHFVFLSFFDQKTCFSTVFRVSWGPAKSDQNDPKPPFQYGHLPICFLAQKYDFFRLFTGIQNLDDFQTSKKDVWETFFRKIKLTRRRTTQPWMVAYICQKMTYRSEHLFSGQVLVLFDRSDVTPGVKACTTKVEK